MRKSASIEPSNLRCLVIVMVMVAVAAAAVVTTIAAAAASAKAPTISREHPPHPEIMEILCSQESTQNSSVERRRGRQPLLGTKVKSGKLRRRQIVESFKF